MDPRVEIVARGYHRIAETFFASFEPPENRRLVEAARLTIVRDEVVTFAWPEGPAQFQWVLARR